jgi:hypothetical protein
MHEVSGWSNRPIHHPSPPLRFRFAKRWWSYLSTLSSQPRAFNLPISVTSQANKYYRLYPTDSKPFSQYPTRANSIGENTRHEILQP